jgi:hypothetical protein
MMMEEKKTKSFFEDEEVGCLAMKAILFIIISYFIILTCYKILN